MACDHKTSRGYKEGRKQYVRVNCIPIKENTVFDTLEFMRVELTWFDSEGGRAIDRYWVWLGPVSARRI